MGEVEEVGGLGDVDSAGGAEQGLELAVPECLGLGEEVEDATAVVVDDDDADGGLDPTQSGESADVVEQAEVAAEDRRRPAARRRGACGLCTGGGICLSRA